MGAMKSKKGYTLIELLVVIAIISVLLSVMIPVISGVVQSSRLRGDRDMAKSYESAIDLWMSQDYNKDIVYYQNLSSSITFGSYNEITYTDNFMGTKQLPGIEFTSSRDIRRATIAAMKAMIKESVEVQGTELYLKHPTSTGYGYKYYYLMGVVSVEEVGVGYNLYNGDNYNYYIWLDYQPGASENVSAFPIEKFNKITGATSSSEQKATFMFNFSLSANESAEHCVFEISNSVQSFTLSGKTTTPQVFLAGEYNIRFLYNGELKYDSYVHVTEDLIYGSTVTISFDGSSSLQLSSNPQDFAYENMTDPISGMQGVSIKGYSGSDKNVVIPSKNQYGKTVYGISANAFNGNNNVERIIVAPTITTLSSNAIFNCDSLKYVSIPSSNLSSYCISNCDNLRDVNFYIPSAAPLTVRSVANDAISNCYMITNLNLTYLYRNISSSAFFSLTNNNNIKVLLMAIPEEISINNPEVYYYFTSYNALDYNRVNKNVWLKVPTSTSVSTELNIASNIRASNGTSFDIIDTIREPNQSEIDSFRPYRDRYTKLYIEEGYKHINNNAFKYMQIKEIYLPITLETIGNDAFNGNRCTSLEIPSSVTHVGDRAFASETLQTLTVKCDISALSNLSLAGCTRLTTLLICNYDGDQENISPEDFGLNSNVNIIFA